MADAEGFQVVKKRKGQKNRKCGENNGSSSKSRNINTCFETSSCDVNELKTKIDKCRHEKVYSSTPHSSCILLLFRHFYCGFDVDYLY